MKVRLPVFYGWCVIAVAFVTMAIGVNARTAFSLLFPPILDEFGWDRSVTAGAFSFGFLVSAVLSPLVGRLIDSHGPRIVLEAGVASVTAGLLLATRVREPWQLYATLGALVGTGANCLGYTAHAAFLPQWFVRRRGLAMSLAFSGVGVASIIVLPWLQAIIARDGWRAACWAMGVLVVAVLAPLNLLVRHRPEDLGLKPDGDGDHAAASTTTNVVEPGWVAIEWTLARALRTARFWWIAAGYSTAMFAWYLVQVHQTKYLIDIGFSPTDASWALSFVSLVAVPGQIGLGHLSDRVGREWVWTIGTLGFAMCYAILLLMARAPTQMLLCLMVASQGMLGYSLTSVIGAIPAEIFEGRRFGTIYGSLMIATIAGGAAGPWIGGLLYDATGAYRVAFLIAIACCGLSAVAIWRAAPRQIRAVAGRMGRTAPE